MTSAPNNDVLLSVRDLSLTQTGSDAPTLVDDVSFTLAPGERLGIIGESGSGKTLTALSVLGLPPESLAQRGSVQLTGMELVGVSDRARRRLRGRTVSMVFQEPLTALDPLMRVGKQLEFAARQTGVDVNALLDDVSLPHEAARRFPHELSGGQRQRALIAMAMAGRPDVLICDEPTTALDAGTQASVLNVIYELTARHGTALLFITHDLKVAASMCDSLLVMHDGRVVERGATEQILNAPSHDYTRRLIAASQPPKREAVSGCPADERPAVRVHGVSKDFGRTHALADVSLTVPRGERLGIVGGSGSGKTTLLSIIAGLEEPTSGRVDVDGHVQMVFQDPHGSLDPRMRVGDIIAEGLGSNAREHESKVAAMLEEVGLEPSAAQRFPHEFSGGQRQRISIARALIGDPDIVLADEAVSALDVSVRGQILDLLDRQVRERGLTLLFISHDLGVVRGLCDRVAVIHDGKLVEVGATEDTWAAPQAEYTRSLIEAATTTR